ncbi:MAG: ketose-bisphosphate aldolase [Firmicutes bacterium]|nr:ketose-bisphosphate aldolase [Bacillota bacterium]
MKLSTTKELFVWANKHQRAVCAFNVNNMELIQAVTTAADELGVPIILQISKGARNYAQLPYLMKLIEAAVSTIKIPVAVHLDHGDSFELCKEVLDAGFTSVMIDGSHLPFEDNIALTKKVVDYANKTGASVEGELGTIGGIEEEKSNEKSLYTDPTTVKEYVERTGVTSLAISIGTAHGAFKYTTPDPQLRFDILEQINREIPHIPLVLHGASSVTPADLDTINAHGGQIKNAIGVSESVLAKSIPLGIRKINIDSDLRLAFTAALRAHFVANPEHFDPRQYLGAARAHVSELVKHKLLAFSVLSPQVA